MSKVKKNEARRVLKFWSNDSNYASFTGAKTVWDAYIKNYPKSKLSLTDLTSILETDQVYQMHVLGKVNFTRRSLKARGNGIDFQADLGFLFEYDGYNCFLILIDIWSNFVYTVPMKEKTGLATRKALRSVFASMPDTFKRMATLTTDKGSEFISNRDFLKEKGIILFLRQKPQLAFLAERYIRSLKSRLYKQMRKTQKRDWPEILKTVTKNLNNTPSKGVLSGLVPAEINSSIYDPQVREVRQKNLAKKSKLRQKKKKKERAFSVGEWVYVDFGTSRKMFKGFDMQRGRVYKIEYIDNTDSPLMYNLSELNGKPITGRKFYGAEMRKAKDPSQLSFPIEKWIRKRNLENGVIQYLVKYLHYDNR